MRLSRRLSVVFAAVLALTSPAFGQITWNFTYSDPAGSGFNDATVGQLRKDSLIAASQYLSSMLDGRGNINANLNVSDNNTGTGTLASFGPSFPGVSGGNFQNGLFYHAARMNNVSGTAGSGQFNFGWGWNYVGQTPSGSNFDMVTVSIHELTHGLGFLSLLTSTGGSEFGGAAGTPNTYSGYDRFLQRGNGALSTSALFTNNTANSAHGTFNGPVSTLTTPPTNTTNGLFFGGQYAREANGNAPVGLYAPTTYNDGSSVSHVNATNAVMYYAVSQNTVKRFQAYEIGMMLDMGWNVYNWNATKNSTANTGNWGDGLTTLANSRWTTDSGITRTGGVTYNTFSFPNEAPVLPVYGQTTANIVLNFRNTGTTNYTSTNDLGTVRLARLNLNSTSSGSTTITGGTLNFGLNADGSPSVLVPKIVQSGSGAVTVGSNLQVNAISTFNVVVNGTTVATYTGHNGLTVEGTGSGTVTLSGVVSGTGGLTKNNSFNLVLSGNNTYTGATTVNGGTVFVTGNSTNATGAVTVNSGATLTGNGTVGGAVTINGGGTLEGGNGAIGTLAVADNVTIQSTGILRAQLGSGTSADLINMTGSAYALDLRNGAVVTLVSSGFTAGSSVVTYTLADLNATDAALLKLNGVNLNSDTTITTFTSTGGINGTNVNNTGQVNIALSGFNLTAGDKFTLRRSNTGDLVVVFTPLPEPGGILLVCGLVAASGLAWRKWRKRGV